MWQLAAAKDPEAAFFKRLEGLQPCEISELKAGTHIFAVYGMPYAWNALSNYLVSIPWPRVTTVWFRLGLATSLYPRNFVGDNFFKTASYTIEALCASSYSETIHKLKEVEAQMLQKRTELRDFEMEYKRVSWIFSYVFCWLIFILTDTYFFTGSCTLSRSHWKIH